MIKFKDILLEMQSNSIIEKLKAYIKSNDKNIIEDIITILRSDLKYKQLISEKYIRPIKVYRGLSKLNTHNDDIISMELESNYVSVSFDLNVAKKYAKGKNSKIIEYFIDENSVVCDFSIIELLYGKFKHENELLIDINHIISMELKGVNEYD